MLLSEAMPPGSDVALSIGNGHGETFQPRENGSIAGGVIVADVSGPDRVLFTGDDCSGDDGTLGTSDDGEAQSSYLVNGSGTGTTGYCSAYFTDWQGMRPFRILSFHQE